MPTYYPNDVVCRVRSGSGGGTEIDVGTVDYPLTTCGPLGPKSLEQLLAGGFEEGWDFSVTWGHRNVLEGRRNDIPVDKRREKINSSDQMVFLLDRPFNRGMYVRRTSDLSSFGIVKDIEISVCVQNFVGSVISDMDIHGFEYNWITENMLGACVTINGWIGQIVEIEKEAQMKMEENSQFMLEWVEKLNEYDFKKETFIFPEEWERMEPHLRFRTVGDKVMFTSTEFSKVKWISQPENKSWFWNIIRPYHYHGRAAEVEAIGVREVLFLWSKRLPFPLEHTATPKPPERLKFAEIEKLVNEKKFKILSCMNPEDRRVGSTVFVKNSVNTRLNTSTYDKWARDYLRELHTRSVSVRNDTEPTSKRARKGFKRDQGQGIFTGVGQFTDSVGIAGTHIQADSSSFPAKIIARTSIVLVEFPTGEECLDSTELLPVLLNDTFAYPVGSLVQVDETKCGPIVDSTAVTYGIILGYEMTGVESGHAVVSLFSFTHDVAPTFLGRMAVGREHISLHPLFRMNYGDLVVRASPYDPIIGGTFIRGLESGSIVVATSDGHQTAISPFRVVVWKIKPAIISVLDAVQDVCCSPETNSEFTGKTEYWTASQDNGKTLFAHQSVTLRDPNPSNLSLSFWNLRKFQSFNGSVYSFIKDCYLHRYADSRAWPEKDSLYMEILKDNMDNLDPNKYWFRISSTRKDLVFCAMTGPVTTIYEDILFLFHIRFLPTYHGPADVYFESYFEYDVIPDTEESADGNAIAFSWRTGTNDAEKAQVDTYDVKMPFLTRFFHQITNTNLRAEPLAISFGGTIGSFLLSNATQKLIDEIYVRTELARYIIRQIMNATPVWGHEIFSFYRIHLPMYFHRQLNWVYENTKDNTLMGCIVDKRDDLLENLYDLMYIYNKYL